MSIKDLFYRNKPYKIATSASLNELSNIVESPGHIEEYTKEKDRFVPLVNFDNPELFARYGSAEEYYRQSFERISNTYPYDGSKKEKIRWHNSSSYLDNWIFNNQYPRTAGHIVLGQNWGNATLGATHTIVASSNINGTDEDHFMVSAKPQYIHIKGGPNPAAIRPYDGSSVDSPDFKNPDHKANIFDRDRNRSSNLLINGASGSTVEFWFKAGGTAGNNAKFLGPSPHIAFFDLWNSGTIEAGSNYSGSYGRFLVEMRRESAELDKLRGDKLFYITYMSGTTGAERVPIGAGSLTGTYGLDSWNHYAFSVKNSGISTADKQLELKLYINGELQDTVQTGSAVGRVTKGPYLANLGAYLHAPTTASAGEWGFGLTGSAISYSNEGIGCVSGSFDEFRYWKERRKSDLIDRYYFTQVAGGTNTDNANTDLGVYYKFNEGITQTASVDRNVLDYSGRISNAEIINYDKTLNMRMTGSAIVSASAATFEFEDPIIYPYHPDVKTVRENYVLKGRRWDYENPAWIYNTLPAWVVEDEEKTGQEAKKLFQIIASYFDTLQMQIQNLPRLKDVKLISGSYDKPIPFANQLLESVGFFAPEIFADATILNTFLNRDDHREFDKKLYDIKNFIYENIYQNLVYINKTKGTEKSIRNLIRCFGVDDELYKINFYADNAHYKLENNYKFTTVRKNYADFSNSARWEASVFQSTGSASSQVGYIKGSGDTTNGFDSDIGMCVEAEVLFPNIANLVSPNEVSSSFNYLTSSMFGMHTAKASAADLSWASNDYANFQVYAVRDKVSRPNSKNAYFQLTSTTGGIMASNEITSSLFYDVYNNQKWNFAVNVKPRKYPNVSFVSSSADDYTVEFRGICMAGDIVKDEFFVTGTVSNTAGKRFMTNNKRIYAGAHRQNFTGSPLQLSNIRASSLRAWMVPLTRDELLAHSRDATNYGVFDPARSAYLNEVKHAYDGIVPRIETLALNWDFANVTGSDASGEFFVDDASSGSNEAWRYGALSDVLEKQHTGRGMFFKPTDSGSISREYVHTAKTQMIENLNNESFVQVLDQDDEYFQKSRRPIRYFFTVEKSMYQTISDEMIDLFANAKQFQAYANLIGNPVDRYRMEYKGIKHLNRLFFDKVKNTPDLERYTRFYSWLDDSISAMIHNVVPATADFSGVENVVESHLFERNKYQHMFPTLELKHDSPSGSLNAINELKYNWKYGHAPLITSGRTTATATITFTGTFPFMGSGAGGAITIVDAAGTTMTMTLNNGISTSTAGVIAGDGAATAAAIAQRFAQAVNLHAGKVTASPTDGSSATITLTQDTAGIAGNKTNTNPVGNTKVTLTNFTGGTDRRNAQSQNCIWWKEKAERQADHAPNDFSTNNDGVNKSRSFIHTATLQTFDRKFSTPYDFIVDDVRDMGSKNVRTSIPHLSFGSNNQIVLLESDIPSDLAVSGCDDKKELFPPNKVKTNVFASFSSPKIHKNLLPFSIHSSSLTTSVSNNFKSGLIFTNQHLDLYHTFENEPLQTPFTREHVGGSQHRHISLNKGAKENLVERNRDGRLDDDEIRPEGWVIKFDKPLAKAASATISATGSWPYMDNGSNITLKNAAGANVVVTLSNATSTSSSGVIGGDGVSTAALMVQRIAQAINATTSTMSASPTDGSADSITITQATAGSAGNQNITTTNADASLTVASAFTGGEDNEKRLRLVSPDFDGTDKPRASYLRDETAKRPVNVKNINYNTASALIGNYKDNYEIFMTSGRNINNHYFAENMGISVTGSESTAISNILDFTLPDRSRDAYKTKSIIAERFSAPGDPSTLSRGYLDAESETFSVYNALPWRNLSVRLPLISLLSASSGQFGLKSDYSFPADPTTTELNSRANYHKVNRNSAKRIEHEFSVLETAKATITFTGTFPFMGSGAGGAISIVDTAGTTMTMTLNNGISTSTAGVIAGDGAGTPAAIAQRFAQAVNLHTGNVTASPTDGSSATITLTQDTAGSAGNRTNTNPVGNTKVTLTNFAGGLGIPGSDHRHVTYTTGTLSDNWYMQHAIPQSDMQYAWITSSAQATTLYGYEQPDHSNAGGASNSITFVSSSDVGSFDRSGTRYFGATKAQVAGHPISTVVKNSIIPTTFVGMNTNIVDPITSSLGQDNVLGYDNSKNLVSSYVNIGSQGEHIAPGADAGTDSGEGNFVDIIRGASLAATASLTGGEQGDAGANAMILNSLLLHRNGPYGHPSWKQWRGGEHPISRYLKKTNGLSFTVKTHSSASSQVLGSAKGEDLYTQETIRFNESPITSKYRPIVHEAALPGQEALVDIVSGHGNNKTRFKKRNVYKKINILTPFQGGFSGLLEYSPSEVQTYLGIEDDGPSPNVFDPRGSSAYEKLKKLYITQEMPAASNPLLSKTPSAIITMEDGGKKAIYDHTVKSMLYKEVVFPDDKNTYLNIARTRENWNQTKADMSTGIYGQQRTYWRSKQEDRERTDATGDSATARNSMNFKVERLSGFPHYELSGSASAHSRDLSVWPLDTDGHGGAVFSHTSKGTDSQLTGDDPMWFTSKNNGELSNDTTWTMYFKDFEPTASISYEYIQLLHFSGAFGNRTGRPHGDANSSAKLPLYKTNELIGVDPWFDTYEDYASDIRLMGQGYSILPEFKISDHMAFYHKNGFFFRNKQYLELEGASTVNADLHTMITGSSTSRTADPNLEAKAFVKTYATTKPLEFHLGFQEDHAAAVPKMMPNMLTLSFNGIMKLLPYQGFYPALRTVQLASMLSQSFGPHIGPKEERTFPTKPDGLRTDGTRLGALLQPFFAPGIMYNTVKSGVAVDWATYIKDVSTDANMDVSDLFGAGYISGTELQEPNFRFPFEALVEPERYIPISGTNNGGRVAHVAPQWSSYQGTIAGGTVDSSAASATFTFTGAPNNGEKIGLEDLYGVEITGTVSTSVAASNRAQIGLSGVSSNETRARAFKDWVTAAASAYGAALTATRNSNVVTVVQNDIGAAGNTDITKAGGTILANVTISNADVSGDTVANFAGGSNTRKSANLSYFDWEGTKSDPKYSLAMHNFLAEIPNFFLKNRGLTTLASLEQSEWSDFEFGVKYYMDIVMYKTPDFVMYEGPASYQSPTVGGNHSNATGSARGMHYGPNAMWTTDDGANGVKSFIRNLGDPAPAPWTPPYFYGTSVARIKFDPADAGLTSAQKVSAFTLDEIFSKATIEYFNEKQYASALKDTSDGGANNHSVNTPASASQMQLSSSMNLFGKATPDLVKYQATDSDLLGGSYAASTVEPGQNPIWVISPKFECPIMDFSGNAGPTPGATPSTAEAACFDSKGMWRGSGSIPNDGDGIWLALRESFPKKLPGGLDEDATIGSLLQNCKFQQSSKPRRMGELADKKTISEAIVAIPMATNPNTGEKEFIPVDPGMYRHIYKNVLKGFPDVGLTQGQAGYNQSNPVPKGIAGGTVVDKTSIGQMIRNMRKYYLPPELDFTNPEAYDYTTEEGLSPFAIYFFEFEHSLDREDLQRIWQNVMPKISVSAKKATRTISHQVGQPWEFFAQFNSDTGNFTQSELPADLTWHIFKVKRRAANNYYGLTPRFETESDFQNANDLNTETGTTAFGDQFGSGQFPHSYNWPYDFFSLVELAQMEAEISYDALPTLDIPGNVDPTGGFVNADPNTYSGMVFPPVGYSEYQAESTSPKGDES